MDKEYTRLLDEFYYVAYRLAASTSNDETNLERKFKKLKTRLNEIAPLDDGSQKLWNHTIDYYRAIFNAGISEEIFRNQRANEKEEIACNRKTTMTKEQMLDRIRRTKLFVYYKKSGLEESRTERFVEWTITGLLQTENVEYEEYFDREAYERDVRSAERSAEEYVDDEERMYNYVHRDGPYTNKERYEQGRVGETDYMAQWAYRCDRVDSKIPEINRDHYQKTKAKHTRKTKWREYCGFYLTDASTNEIVFVAFENGIRNRLINWFPWYIAAHQPSDIIPEGFSSDIWIMSMMVNAERKKEYERAIAREKKYNRSERRREIFEQCLHILKYVITGIVAICVLVFSHRIGLGLQERLLLLFFVPGMVYLLVLNQYLP